MNPLEADQQRLWSDSDSGGRGRSSPSKPIASSTAGSSSGISSMSNGNGVARVFAGTGALDEQQRYSVGDPSADIYSSYASPSPTFSPTAPALPTSSSTSSHNRSFSSSSTGSPSRSPFTHAPPVLLSPLARTLPNSPDSENSNYSPKDEEGPNDAWAGLHFPTEEEELPSSLSSPYLNEILKKKEEEPVRGLLGDVEEPIRRQGPISIVGTGAPFDALSPSTSSSSLSLPGGEAAWWKGPSSDVDLMGKGLSMSVSPGVSSLETRNDHSPLGSYDAPPPLTTTTTTDPMSALLDEVAAFDDPLPSATTSSIGERAAEAEPPTFGYPLPPPTFQTTAPLETSSYLSQDPPSPKSLSLSPHISAPPSNPNISPRSPSPVTFSSSLPPTYPSIPASLVPPRSSSKSSSRTSSRGVLNRERASSSSSVGSSSTTSSAGERRGSDLGKNLAESLPLPDSPSNSSESGGAGGLISSISTKTVRAPSPSSLRAPSPANSTTTESDLPAPPTPTKTSIELPLPLPPPTSTIATSPPKSMFPPRKEKKPPPPPLTEKSMQRRKTISSRNASGGAPQVNIVKVGEEKDTVTPLPAEKEKEVSPPLTKTGSSNELLSPSSSTGSGLDRSRESVSDFADVYGQFKHAPTPLTGEFDQSSLPPSLQRDEEPALPAPPPPPPAHPTIIHSSPQAQVPEKDDANQSPLTTPRGSLFPRSTAMSVSPSNRFSIRSEGSVEEFHDAPMSRGLSNDSRPPTPAHLPPPNLDGKPMDAKAKAAAFVADLKRARLAASNSNNVSPATITTDKFDSAPSSANVSPYVAQSAESFGTREDDATSSAAPSTIREETLATPILTEPTPPMPLFAEPLQSVESASTVDEDVTVRLMPQPAPVLEDRNHRPPSRQASFTQPHQLRSPDSGNISLQSPSFHGQDFDMEKLCRSRFLPDCVKTADVRKTKAAGDRARMYALKINALAKENSGANVWISYVRHHYAQSVLGTPVQVSSSSVRSRNSREEASSASSIAFPLRGGESYRARELSQGQFSPTRDMQPTTPYPGVLNHPNLRYQPKQVSALAKTSFFSLGRKGSKRAAPPSQRTVSGPGGLTIGSPLGMGVPGGVTPPPGSGVRSGPRMPGEPRTSISSARDMPISYPSPTLPHRAQYSAFASPPTPQFSDPATSPELQKLADILPYLSTAVLADALERAGGDEVLAISLALESNPR